MSERSHSTELRNPRVVTWRDVAAAVARYRYTALATFVVVVAASILMIMLATPIFRSEVLVVPTGDRQSGAFSASQLGQFSALAGLAGIELPIDRGGNTAQISLEVLRSRGFLAEFVEHNELLPVLYSENWDAEKNAWKESRTAPSIDSAVNRFRRLIKVDESNTGSTIRIGVEWRDRALAAQWANDLVALLNERMRKRAIDQAGSSLKYLESQLEETTAVEVRQSVYRLIEEQMNNLMLANVNREYAFEILDAATPSDRPRRPARRLLFMLGIFAGVTLAALAVALRSGFSRAAAES